MRWEELFEDLEAQADAEEADHLELDVADLLEAEVARIPLRRRLAATAGREVRLSRVDGVVHHGVVLDTGRDWVLLGSGAQRFLIPEHALAWVEGLGRAEPAEGARTRRLGLGHVLRGCAAAGLPVNVVVPGGRVSGLVVAVGADHLDVEQDGVRVVSVPFSALISVAL